MDTFTFIFYMEKRWIIFRNATGTKRTWLAFLLNIGRSRVRNSTRTLSTVMVLAGFLSLSKQILEWHLKIVHYRCLSHALSNLSFIIILSLGLYS